MRHCRHEWKLRTWGRQPITVYLLGLVIGVATAATGCATLNPIDYKAPASVACDRSESTVALAAFALSPYQPLPVDVLEQKLRFESFTILEAKSTSRGTTGAMRLKIQFRDCSVVQVKWKAASSQGQAYNNSPRKQLAAYAVQKLFLEPKDYVVPVTAAICLPAGQLAEIGARATPQIAGTDCVFGIVAVWLSNVTVPKRFLDRDRFEESVKRGKPDGYAWHMGNFNLFTYLISHRDARRGNFLVSALPDTYHAFSIDNDLAFSGLGNPRPFVPIWRRIKVHTLPRPTVDRLRTLTREQLQDHLETFAEFRFDLSSGIKPSVQLSDNLDPRRGVRNNGRFPPDKWIGQLGMTEREIDQIMDRLKRLLERIDEREIELFL